MQTSKEKSNNSWLPSRFNVISNVSQNELLLYNSYTGAIINVSAAEKDEVLQFLKRGGTCFDPSDTFTQLTENGFLVPNYVDEDLRAKFLHQSLHRTDILHLVILPTEACNFRCTYCYQDFPRGKMDRSVVNGLKQLFKNKAHTLRHAGISWFGGEPLLAMDIIEELSKSFMQTAADFEIEYSADISTNGFLLTTETFRRLLDLKVSRYMITLDGPAELHDRRRHLTGGGNTFTQIFDHLKQIQKLDDKFEIDIRINFDKDNLETIPQFTDILSNQFANDPRFQIFYRPVGRWGGINDDTLPICDSRIIGSKIWDFTQLGIDRGLKMSSTVESLLMPGGSVCYAAKPYSLVVGANGTLYKCTCAFDAANNQIGFLQEDGTTVIDYDKFALWVSSGDDQDPGCKSCFFRPSCQGNHCPLYRMETGKRPCPYEKRKITRVLDLIWQNYKMQNSNEENFNEQIQLNNI